MLADRLVEPLPIGLRPTDTDDRAARRTLREQVGRLEGELSATLASAFPFATPDVGVPGCDGPRLLDLGQLERLRDALADRLHAARGQLAARGEREAAARLQLERMLADPRRHRFLRVARADLGVAGCGYYEARPRLGLVGMLMGWWQVKLSSGCPATGRG